MTQFEAVKDEDAAHPVPTRWRPILRDVVASLVNGDYELSQCATAVQKVSPSVAQSISNNIRAYGERLVTLPDDAWETSCCQWMRTHWEVLVDLWTAESGRSDLVLSARVTESGDDLHVIVDSVHVP